MMWKQVKLGEIVSLQRGYDLPERDRKPGNVPVYGSAGITGYHNIARAKGPGVTVGRSGASFGVANYSPSDFWPHNAVLFVTNFHGNDKRFVYYFLKNLDFSNLNSGSAQPSLNRNYVYQLEVKVPPVDIQRKITAVLSAYDDLIENNTRRIAILEEMAQRLYREWFVHFRFPGHEGVALVEVDGKGVGGNGRLPEGWQLVLLEEICDLTLGQSPPSTFYNEDGEGLPFHQGVADFGSRFPTDRVYCTQTKRTAEAGDILFSVRAPVGRINIARHKIVIGRGLHAIRSKTGHQAFIFQQLKDKFHEEDMMGGGTIFKSVTKSDMLNLQLIFPTAALADEFEAQMRPIFRELEILFDKNANLRQTRDLLLPRLISGQIDLTTRAIQT